MTALNSWALTSVADVKESLGITNGAQDNLITRKINQATDIIEGYCGLDNNHHFREATYTDEYIDGTYTDQLQLKAWPVTTLTSLGSRDSYENQNNFTTLETDQYYLKANTATVTGLSRFYGGVDKWRATYTAGFSTIPSDLAEACVTLVTYLIDNASTGAGVKKKEEGQRSIEYFQTSGSQSLIEDLSLDDVLQRYVRYAI